MRQESQEPKARKLRRYFTSQKLLHFPHDLRLDPDETRHLRNSIRLKSGDACLVTDGQGGEAEALVGEFGADGRVGLCITRILKRTGSFADVVRLRVFPVMLRKGKTDFLVAKAQELGVREFRAITSEHGEVQVAEEKTEKILRRWQKIVREASKQSGNLELLRVEPPQSFKMALEGLPPQERVVIFHPGPEAVPFAEWLREGLDLRPRQQTLNLFIGPEGGFSEEEIRWARWYRKDQNIRLVGLGDVLFKADTAFVGILAALRFSGSLSA